MTVCSLHKRHFPVSTPIPQTWKPALEDALYAFARPNVKEWAPKLCFGVSSRNDPCGEFVSIDPIE